MTSLLHKFSFFVQLIVFLAQGYSFIFILMFIEKRHFHTDQSWEMWMIRTFGTKTKIGIGKRIFWNRFSPHSMLQLDIFLPYHSIRTSFGFPCKTLPLPKNHLVMGLLLCVIKCDIQFVFIWLCHLWINTDMLGLASLRFEVCTWEEAK